MLKDLLGTGKLWTRKKGGAHTGGSNVFSPMKQMAESRVRRKEVRNGGAQGLQEERSGAKKPKDGT